MDRLLTLSYAAGATAKFAFYAAHYGLARITSAPFDRPGDAPFTSDKPKPDPRALRKAFLSVFSQDLANIEAGLYLLPDAKPQLSQTRKSLAYLRDVRAIDKRRLAKQATEVRDVGLGEGYPAYFRQNFHWQSGGWLTPESADLYDFQVETLFTGSAGPMRRSTALALLAQSLKGVDQRKTSLVELACGTGQMAGEIMRNFPRLNLTALDMSPAYAHAASRALAPYRCAKAMSGAAEATPFRDASFDRALSIYLFHELPPKVRTKVVRETARILKPGGYFIIADALQTSDHPQLDRLLDAFPIGFHEPFFTSWLTTDMQGMLEANGFELVDQRQAFLTKAWSFRRL
ncbi:class I SAM-dependent methyltransferase [Candidatus Phycosocius spiralis]|uniref:Methyltransferase n=1 Tax=Candidatus Phycosocius spiralis TaxID=2815099 RepID=A0ABQ4PY18_9PROT|nr:class I SAM-dependent methyltransferase [Candidatus Phycosocius spiralis]GIU67902.1 methyltransferase [Candidatus Phycosocius spiralis]